MRRISEQRKLVESERHEHIVRRGRMWVLHLENMPWLHKIFKWFLKAGSLRKRGRQNAVDVRMTHIEFNFANLPTAFDNTKILFITDTHIDAFEELADKIMSLAVRVDYDYCILGGDYNFGYRQESGLAYLRMRKLAQWLVKRSRVFGILGNHDRYRMAQALNDCGVEMLINESLCIEKNGDRIYISGLDDCHYYYADDINLAEPQTEPGAFKIMLCHSPEMYKTAVKSAYSLYLAGHTHGGQVCLPGSIALVTGATVPRALIKGKWRYDGMAGFTSRGAGVSAVPVRFNCPPEIAVISLKKGD